MKQPVLVFGIIYLVLLGGCGNQGNELLNEKEELSISPAVLEVIKDTAVAEGNDFLLFKYTPNKTEKKTNVFFDSLRSEDSPNKLEVGRNIYPIMFCEEDFNETTKDINENGEFVHITNQTGNINNLSACKGAIYIKIPVPEGTPSDRYELMFNVGIEK